MKHDDSATNPPPPLRILHLEDSALDRALVRSSLERAGLACTISAVETLHAFEQQLGGGEDFDLILADYYLPGCTGMDAWRLVRSVLGAPPPFVLLSGAIGEAAAVEAMRQGISDCVMKQHVHRLAPVILQALQVHRAQRERERAVAGLAASERRLAELTGHLHDIMEQGRTSVAREIHDDIGGALTAAKFDLAWIVRNAANDNAQDVRGHARCALQMIDQALGTSQRIMQELRPPVLDQGLMAAVQWLVQDFERRSGVRARLHSALEHIDIAQPLQVVAYRTVQEALINVAKHARDARHVRVDINVHEDFLRVEIADDGCGLPPDALERPRSFGLRGLHERARSVGGRLDIGRPDGGGTRVRVAIPLKILDINS